MRTDHRVAPPVGFLDGDLLQRFLSRLSPAEREMIIRGQSAAPGASGMMDLDGEGDDADGEGLIAIAGTDVAQVTKLIENLSRVC